MAKPGPVKREGFSDLERRVLRAALEGYQGKQIMHEFGLSPAQLDHLTRRARAIMKTPNTIGAAFKAYKDGIL
jgi:DNA-binding CsgD family transcriptional regulator